jgi:FlaA1/EpsC-like NDP-sugar epimerase
MESTFLLSSRHSYLIAGGLGDLGCCVARWMARRGARSLILLSRSGARTETAKAMITDLEALGVKIRTPLCDVGNLASLREALQQCSDMATIKGCVQASGNLKVRQR